MNDSTARPHRWQGAVLASLLALLAGAAAAQAAPRPGSPACGQALARLDAHEASLLRPGPAREPSAAARPPDPRLQALRREAARACLGQPDDSALTPVPAARAPIAVPPVTAAPRVDAGASPAARPLALPPPAAPPAALSLSACDATGCWASDGSRLTRVGSQLLGKRPGIPS